jgi:membrane protein
MKSRRLQELSALLKATGTGFIKDKVPKLSASLAYYTIFSMGPMLMVVIFLTDLFWSKQAIEGVLFGQLKDIVGDKAALQIQQIIKNAAISGNNTVTVIIGFVMLLISATSVFAEIQDSINMIWKLKADPRKGWLVTLRNRLVSFSLLVTLGFLLLVSLIINGIVAGFMDKLQQLLPDISIILIYVVNLLISLLITSALFAIIFKVLPDAVIRWKDVFAGAVVTAILFMLARFAIAYYIAHSHPGSAYGTAGSIIILLLWIYFSAFILYFGAEFTKCYALKFGQEIKPNDYANTIQTVHIKSKKSVQENEQATASGSADK